jgi:hypothetical protein
MKLQLRHELPLTNVVEGWKRRSIRPNPEYQRGRAWSLDQRRLLIDSALRGYPLPRFYFSVEQAHDPLGNVATSLDVIADSAGFRPLIPPRIRPPVPRVFARPVRNSPAAA